MKKLLLSLLTLMVVMLMSCTSEDNIVGLSTENETEVVDSAMQAAQRNFELAKLQSNINEFNVATFGQQYDVSTRSFLGNLLKKAVKFFVTVAADAVGGVVGGVAGGITASGIVGGALLFKVDKVVMTPFPSINSWPSGLTRGVGDGSFVNPFNYVVPKGTISYGDSIGYYHNKVLSELFSDSVKVASFVDKSYKEQAQIIVDAMAKEPYLCKYYGDDLTDPTKADAGINAATTIMQIAEEVETEDEFFARVDEAGLADSPVMGVLREILEGFENVDPETDEGEYYETVLGMINKSGLDTGTKQILTDGVIIGQASNRLWKAGTILHDGYNSDTYYNPGMDGDTSK